MTRLLWTAFGLGLAPKAPGTCGTLAGVALAWLVTDDVALAIVAAALFLAGVPLARAAARATGREDPGSFVLDEVAGYLVAVLWLPRTPLALAAAFVLFRLFDIWKPPPIRRLERLPGGWGVMADDVLAGAYARAALLLVPL